jgi:hypothetical protein
MGSLDRRSNARTRSPLLAISDFKLRSSLQFSTRLSRYILTALREATAASTTSRRPGLGACRSNARRRGQGRGLQHAVEGVVLGQVALLDIGGERGVAPVAAKLLQPRRVHPAVLGGVHRAALEAVAAERLCVEPGHPAAGRLADHVDRFPMRRGGVLRPRRRPDAAEQRPRGDAGGVAPTLQRAHRAELTDPVRDADLHALDSAQQASALTSVGEEAVPRSRSRSPSLTMAR